MKRERAEGALSRAASWAILICIYAGLLLWYIWVQVERTIHIVREREEEELITAPKVPQRLAVIYANAHSLTGDEVAEEIAHIERVAEAFRIESVTVYDRTGVFLRAVLSDGEKEGVVAPYDGVAAYKNKGALITHADERAGKEHFVHVAKTLEKRIHEGRASPDKIDIAYMDREMEEWVREPQLAVVLGGMFLQLHGFPPWQLRLCEIEFERGSVLCPQPRLAGPVMRRAFNVYGAAHMKLGR